MGEPLTHTLRVRYAECDAQNVVFNAHYLAWFDISITELWRAALGSYAEMLDRGVDVVVAAATLRFLRPARFDDQLRLDIALEPLGTTSLPSRHRIWRGDELLVEGALRHVMIDRQSFEKTPVPRWLRDALAPWTLAGATGDLGDATKARGGGPAGAPPGPAERLP